MKRFTAAFVVSGITLLFPLSVFAQDVTSTGTITAPGIRKDAIISRGVERQERMEEKAASREAKLDARKQAIVAKILTFARRMLERANQLIARLDAIWKRVESRMEKIEASGKDLSSLSTQIANVKTKRQNAVDAISSASSSLESLEGSNEPKSAVETFRQSMKNVKDAVRAYHQSIVTVIRSLIGMSGNIRISGIPTASGAATVTGTR